MLSFIILVITETENIKFNIILRQEIIGSREIEFSQMERGSRAGTRGVGRN